MTTIKGAIFDLDGVLADTARGHYLAWKRLADEIGAPFDEAFNERLKGVDRMRSLELILERAQQTYTDDEKAELAERKNGYYRDSIETMSEKDLLPGARRLLIESRSAGLAIALASASKNAHTLLKRFAIAPLFDYVADARHIARHKPDPEIFLTAAEGLKLSPDRCVGVEDAAAGVAAIKAAGMRAVGVGDASILSGADLVVARTADLTIAKLTGG